MFQNPILYANPRLFLILGVFGIFSVGCISKPTENSVVSSPTFHQVTKTSAVATGTPLIPTPSSPPFLTQIITPANTLTTSPTPEILSDCPIVRQGTELNLPAGEVIIFDDWSKLYSVSSSDKQPQPFLDSLPPSTYPDSVSPDHKWLSIDNAKYDKKGNYLGTDLVIASGDGRTIKTMPWDEKWISPSFGWFDKDRLLMIPLAEAEFGTVILFNPFTGEQQEIRNSFPGLLNTQLYRSHSWNSARVIYDPTLSRAIYLSSDPEIGIVLWDLETQQELWRFTEPLMMVRPPVWLPDGKSFIFVAPVDSDKEYFELRIVSRDGQMSQLIDLAFFGETSGHLKLSSDGRYLAFGDGLSYSQQRLILVDLTTRRIIDYCITDDPGIYLPIWSPDGKQFLLFHSNPTYNLLVDVASGTLTQFDISFAPVGWLTIEP